MHLQLRTRRWTVSPARAPAGSLRRRRRHASDTARLISEAAATGPGALSSRARLREPGRAARGVQLPALCLDCEHTLRRGCARGRQWARVLVPHMDTAVRQVVPGLLAAAAASWLRRSVARVAGACGAVVPWLVARTAPSWLTAVRVARLPGRLLALHRRDRLAIPGCAATCCGCQPRAAVTCSWGGG